MTIAPRTRSLIAAAVAVFGAASMPAMAQRCSKPAMHTECSPVMKQMGEEIGSAVVEYWTPKLNDYKVRIDRVLSSQDLDSLNRLRVRWALIMETAAKRFHDQAEATSTPASEGHAKMSVCGGPDEAQLMDVIQIVTSAREIASRYKPEVGPMQGDVLNDVSSFVGVLATRATTFAEANRAAIEKEPELKSVLSKRDDLAGVSDMLRSEKTKKDFAKVYSFAIEPMVFLYNGGDLASLLGQALPIAKPIAGVEIPSASLLNQNFPNPATTTTTISYKVTEASRSTIVRIYNSTGALVATYDQGERGVGEASLDVDVSNLAAGSYLYHLTLQTVNGQRVYSKMMQVVH